MKGPDGHMIGLIQYTGPETDDEDEGSIFNLTRFFIMCKQGAYLLGPASPLDQDDDPNMREIKNILRKIKV